jgi:SAM-dependent methyltransferase
VDRLDNEGLEDHYPELTGRILRPDVLADATELPFPPSSLDFVIASHVLEHMPFPLAALRAWHQALAPGGALLLKIPDKRYTFDVKRERTTLRHLIDEDADPHADQRPHYADWVANVGSPPADFDQAVDDLVRSDYSIHFHVWTSEDVAEIIDHLQLDWKVAVFWNARFYRKETTVVLTR